ncbi:MAG: DNA-directed RNA polymerase subunit beta, partial [Christensenellaceae bacterium]
MQEVKFGTNKRMSFSKIKEVLNMPDLIEIQKNSYKRFLEEGLGDVLKDISPITDYSENLVLEFVDYRILDTPKYEVEECKERDVNYAAPLKVQVRLFNKETGEVKEQEVFMGDFPLMTEKGTFIINGAERVIVSQLVRSPGVYYSESKDKTGKDLFGTTVIPNRGAWLEYETDSNDCMFIRVDRTRKLPVTVFLRAMGMGSDTDIRSFFGDDENIEATLKKDNTSSKDEGLIEIYKRLRPGEPPTVESANILIGSLFFDSKRYDLARVGRYKFNKKLAISQRIVHHIVASNIINEDTGELLCAAGEMISFKLAKDIENAGISMVEVLVGEQTVRVHGNSFVDASKHLDFNPADAGINEKVYYPALKSLIDEFGQDKKELKVQIAQNLAILIP